MTISIKNSYSFSYSTSSPTLYIGEHLHGLYALPSFVDQNMVKITASEAGPLLLEGPEAPDCPKLYVEYPVPGHNYHIPAGKFSEYLFYVFLYILCNNSGV